MRSCPLCSSSKVSKERVLNQIHLLRCSVCNFVYADISIADVEAFNSSYDDDAAKGYKAHKSVLDHVWFERIVDKFTSKMGAKKVLDVGCGDCHLLSIFKEKGWDCYGLDFSPWAKDAAKANQINFESGKIEDGCFGSLGFDLIVSTSTFEHVYQPSEYVKAVLSRLNENGFLYMSGMPNYDSIAVKLNISSFNSNMPPQHVNFFNKNSMEYLLQKDLEVKFKDIFVGTYGIPEVHKIYRLINIKRHKRKENKQEVNTSSNQILRDSAFEGMDKPQTSLAARSAVSLYYLFGKPFHFGDKLEVVVAK